MTVAPERVSGPAWHWKTDRRRVTSEMDGRGSCQDRLESSGTGDVQPTGRPSPVPHPPRRSGAQVAIPPSHHGHDLDRWPLRDTLILGALADAVPSARAHLRHLLSGWGQAEVGPDAGAVVSELVTNSVAASAGLRLAAAPVLVWLGSDSRCLLLLAVADASPRPPVRPNLGPDAERGRGLALVEALSNRWGWHPASVSGLRKVVWAEWRLPTLWPPDRDPRPNPEQARSRRERTPLGPPTPPCRGERPCQDHPCATPAAATMSAG
jgi:hypothetical protein